MSTKSSPPLALGYTSEIDGVNSTEWYALMGAFSDATIYQTWAYAEATWGASKTSRLILKRNGQVVALAQVRLSLLPIWGAGIAYVFRGPMWRRKGTLPDHDILRQALRALRIEFTGRRGLLLRVAPLLFVDDRAYDGLFETEMFSLDLGHERKRTIIMDLSSPIDDLRCGLHRNWKRNLKSAEARKLEVIVGDDDSLFAVLVDIYRDMVHRKKFLEPNEIAKFRQAQTLLPQDLKMRIAICRSGKDACAGLIWSEIGDTAIELFAATRDAALKNGAAYLLRWRLVEWLRSIGILFYNLNGVNAQRNPGGYQFKTGLAGRAGNEVEYLGIFETKGTVFSNSYVRCGQTIFNGYRDLRGWLRTRGKRGND